MTLNKQQILLRFKYCSYNKVKHDERNNLIVQKSPRVESVYLLAKNSPRGSDNGSNPSLL